METAGRWQETNLFLLLWRFTLVISLMQSRPATCPRHRKPPPITTALLSFTHKDTEPLFLEGPGWKRGMKEWEMGGKVEGRKQVCAAFMLNYMGLSQTHITSTTNSPEFHLKALLHFAVVTWKPFLCFKFNWRITWFFIGLENSTPSSMWNSFKGKITAITLRN